MSQAVSVNGVSISEEDINKEVQYHPAGALEEAKEIAARALVVKELLMQKAVALGLGEQQDVLKNPDEVIDKLLEQELNVPEAEDSECKRYYEGNEDRFYSSPLYEASHILFLSPPEEEKLKEAKEKADAVLAQIKQDPKQFAHLAKEHSACSSSGEGGFLGQITKGETLPSFEAALFAMKEGEVSEDPVLSDVGYHIIKLHKHAEGEKLPYDMVKSAISEYLSAQSWQRAFHQYVRVLASDAKIEGVPFETISSPLVQ